MPTKKRFISVSLCLVTLAALFLNSTGCAENAQTMDLMKGVKASSVNEKATDEKFIKTSADFAVKLFQKSITENKSSLISPLSVMLSLAMTANGADSTTKAQIEALIGGDIPLDTENEYLYTYVKNLPSESKSKLNIANSIWFHDKENGLTISKDFLQKNADYYNAAAYKSAFDEQTLEDINSWVKKNTDGMIDKVLDKINADTIMYLINAVVFDAEWQNVYEKNNIYDDTFTALDGTQQTVSMMRSYESKYISDGKATGFIKDYKDSKYSFVALLPNEDVSLNDYIASMTGESFRNTVKNAEPVSVATKMPKFSYDYEITMNDALKALGMPDAFDSASADFSRLSNSTNKDLCIGEVLHKTFISVDELGTKAGAVTKVEINDTSAQNSYSVNLDRPFVYAIVDNATGLPVFMGTVTAIEK